MLVFFHLAFTIRQIFGEIFIFELKFRVLVKNVGRKISENFEPKINISGLCIGMYVKHVFSKPWIFIPEVQKYFVIDFERKNVIFELRKVEFLVIWNISNIFIWREKWEHDLIDHADFLNSKKHEFLKSSKPLESLDLDRCLGRTYAHTIRRDLEL